MQRVIGLLLASLLLVLLPGRPAQAYLCRRDWNPRGPAHRSDLVLTGWVEELADRAPGERAPGVPLTIRVERVYKGQADGEVVTLHHQLWLHPARPRAGDRMLLFLHASNGALVAGPCDPQTILREKGDLPLHLAFVTAGVPGVLQTRTGQLLALAALVVAATCWLWRRRKR